MIAFCVEPRLLQSRRNLVGAGRFERPTPCAQAIGLVSNNSIALLPVFNVPNKMGNLLFAQRLTQTSINRSSFGILLPQLGRCVANRELTRGSTPCITE